MGNTSLTRRVVLSLPLLAARPGAGRAADPLPALYAADRLTGLALRGVRSGLLRPGRESGGGAAGARSSNGPGLLWRFAAASNRAAFARDPGAYAPRLGGYDPEGVAEGGSSTPTRWCRCAAAAASTCAAIPTGAPGSTRRS